MLVWSTAGSWRKRQWRLGTFGVNSVLRSPRTAVRGTTGTARAAFRARENLRSIDALAVETEPPTDQGKK